jgi:hypothetical protein
MEIFDPTNVTPPFPWHYKSERFEKRRGRAISMRSSSPPALNYADIANNRSTNNCSVCVRRRTRKLELVERPTILCLCESACQAEALAKAGVYLWLMARAPFAIENLKTCPERAKQVERIETVVVP